MTIGDLSHIPFGQHSNTNKKKIYLSMLIPCFPNPVCLNTVTHKQQFHSIDANGVFPKSHLVKHITESQKIEERTKITHGVDRRVKKFTIMHA